MCEEKVEKAFGVETRKDSQALFQWELGSRQWAVVFGQSAIGEACELKFEADMAKSAPDELEFTSKFSLKKNLKLNQQLEVN